MGSFVEKVARRLRKFQVKETCFGFQGHARDMEAYLRGMMVNPAS